jgi:hypothetical protein
MVDSLNKYCIKCSSMPRVYVTYSRPLFNARDMVLESSTFRESVLDELHIEDESLLGYSAV